MSGGGVGVGVNLASCWEHLADHQGDQPALKHGGAVTSWRDFEERSARLAQAFQSVGVGPGDNIACALYNSSAYLEAEFAAFKVRAAPCNVNYRYVEKELAYLVDNSDAKVVFFSEELGDRFGNIHASLPDVALWVFVGEGQCPPWAVDHDALIAQHEPAPRIERTSQDLWILYTGGTTGQPKGVMWPHESLAQLLRRGLEPLGLQVPESSAEVVAIADALAAAGATPHLVAAAPLMHGTSGISALFALTQGGSVCTVPGRSFEADELWRTVQSTGATSVSIVGDVFCRPMVESLDSAAAASQPFDLSTLRSVTSSGVMWSQGIKDRLLAHGQSSGAALTLNDSLGASEGVGFAARQSEGASSAETATFTLGPAAAVFTPDGRRIEPGSEESGLLAVSGPIPLGYYGDPVKTAETFREFEGVRWSVPGDWATLAADRTVTLLGRGSVSINSGGEKIFPEEVEEALKLSPEIVDATVVGVPDPRWGAAVTAVVQLTPAALAEEVTDAALIDGLRSSLSGYKLPKHVVRVDRVFRSPNGKADYGWATDVALKRLGVPPDS